MARRKGVPEKFTAEKRAKFLAYLAKYGFVARAAKAAGVGRTCVFDLKKKDPNFSAAWDEALTDYVEDLEAEADRRAYRGTVKPVFQGGKKVGCVREFSDTLLIFRLKGLRPEMYAERQKREVAGEGGGPVQVETTLSPAATDLLARILGHDQD
jgi:hypothetical protein